MAEVYSSTALKTICAVLLMAPSVLFDEAFVPAAGLTSPAGLVVLLLAVALTYLYAEQKLFERTAPQLASPAGWFVPFVGGIVAMVRDPYTFWEAQRRLAPAGISKFYLLGKTVFFSTDTDTSRRILMHNGPDSLQMVRLSAGQELASRAAKVRT